MDKTQEESGRVPTIFIIDDEVNLRTSLLNLFESMDMPAAVFASADDFLENANLTSPGCVLLDVQMPGMGGMELQRKLVEMGNPLPIIFMTGNANVNMSVSAMKAGAFDFLLKPFNANAVIATTRMALEKDQEYREQAAKLAEIRACASLLTPREREVLGYVSDGLMNKQIAFEMGISEVMVKLHRGRMMRKMNARSIVEIVRKFDRVALVQDGAEI